MAYAIQRAAELQALLEGVSLPASRSELVGYARAQDGGESFVADLEALPDRQYRRLDDVAEELVAAQPQSAEQMAKVPREESDAPPGGDDYTNPDPEPGGVRHDAPPDNPPDKAIQQQTQTQKTQQARQARGG